MLDVGVVGLLCRRQVARVVKVGPSYSNLRVALGFLVVVRMEVAGEALVRPTIVVHEDSIILGPSPQPLVDWKRIGHRPRMVLVIRTAHGADLGQAGRRP